MTSLQLSNGTTAEAPTIFGNDSDGPEVYLPNPAAGTYPGASDELVKFTLPPGARPPCHGSANGSGKCWGV